MITREKVNYVLKKLEKYSNTILNKDKFNFCYNVLEKIQNNYDEWINNCPYWTTHYSQHISENFITRTAIDDELYLSCAYFLREYILYLDRMHRRDDILHGDWQIFEQNSKNSIDPNNQALLDILHGDWQTFEQNSKNSIDPNNQALLDRLLGDGVLIAMINAYLGSLSYETSLKETERKVTTLKQSIDTKKDEIRDFLNKKQEHVDRLAAQLEEYKTGYNFVGLSKGFENILEIKKQAKDKSLNMLVVLGVMLVLTPILLIVSRFLNWSIFKYITGSAEQTLPFLGLNLHGSIFENITGWEQTLPFLGLELVFIYFFRVVLNHYNSIQTQIIQLELRQTLCQFIQSYVEYSNENKDNSSLAKFEQLIFSSILSTPDKVPSTFDGVEQLSNFIKTVKKP